MCRCLPGMRHSGVIDHIMQERTAGARSGRARYNQSIFLRYRYKATQTRATIPIRTA